MLERNALVLGEDADRTESIVARLRRANLSVRRSTRASEAVQLVLESRLDLVVVVLPVAGAEKVLAAVRAEGSASRRAGLIAVGGGEGHEDSDLAHGRLANRLLPPTCSPEELDRTVATLLEIAPRIELRGPSRLRLRLAGGMPPELQVANLSESGMLVASREPLPLGAVFGFALDLPSDAEPVRGQAQVVRLARRHGTERGFGVRFLALGGEGAERLRALVERERANANDAIVVAAPVAPAETLDAERGRQELAELTPILDELLRRGLTQRLAVADWYLTGAELGLESLRAFSTILASVHEDRSVSPEASRRLADLIEVQRKLAEFGRGQADLGARVRILIGLRPALERLLLEMREGSSPGVAAARQSGVVAQVVLDVKRLVGVKRGLEKLEELLGELQSPRYLFARASVRKLAERVRADFGALAAQFGLDLESADLLARGRVKRLHAEVARELRAARRRLATVHEKAYSLRFRRLATDDRDADLLDPKLFQVLVDTLAAGSEYLTRAHSAYQHALEAIGADPGLLERASRLARALAAAERGPSGATPVAAPPAEPPSFGGVGKSWSFEPGSAAGGNGA